MLYDIYDFYGKREDDKFHLLAYHNLDTAAFAIAYLENNKMLLNLLKKILKINDEVLIKNIIGFLAALHDIGKFSYEFQIKIDPSFKNKIVPRRIYDTDSHERIGFAFLIKLGILKNKGLIDSICFHHGYPKHSLPFMKECFYPGEILDLYIKKIKNIFNIKKINKPPTEFSYLLNGIIILADWMASSSTEYFDNKINLSSYFKYSLNRARKILRNLKISGMKNININIIRYLNIKKLNNLQRCCFNIKDLGRNTIIEARTGSGKTEAALSIALRLIQQGKAIKIIFALPTLATTSAMAKRVEFLANILGCSHVLAHGKEFKLLGNEIQENCDFFNDNRKKSLLSDFAIVTIDQVFLSILSTKHNNLRLLGLANSVIIVDEVHSYDFYMIYLLKNLLELGETYNIHFIFLSATIPSIVKEELFCINIGKYPCITTSNNIYKFEESTKKIKINLIEPNKDLLDKDFLSKYHKIGVIKNTVSSAQITYRILRKKFKNDNSVRVILLHSRFSEYDRKLKTEELLKLVGKNGNFNGNLIVVSTQVIEQSLDISFDTIISDLCPAEVLIQRAGRINRWNNDDDVCIFVYDASEYEIKKWGMIYYEEICKKTLFFLKNISNIIDNSKNLNEFINYPYGGWDYKSNMDCIDKEYEANIGTLDFSQSYSIDSAEWDDISYTRDSTNFCEEIIMLNNNEQFLFGNMQDSFIKIPKIYTKSGVIEKYKFKYMIFMKNENSYECKGNINLKYSEDVGVFYEKI